MLFHCLLHLYSKAISCELRNYNRSFAFEIIKGLSTIKKRLSLIFSICYANSACSYSNIYLAWWIIICICIVTCLRWIGGAIAVIIEWICTLIIMLMCLQYKINIIPIEQWMICIP